MKKFNVLICALLAALFLGGCSRRAAPAPTPSLPPSTPAPNSPSVSPEPTPDPTLPQKDLAALTALLPSESGYHWSYAGFAEYAHEMELDSIEKSPDEWKYNISGQVLDVSEGEGKGDPSVYVTYIADGEKIVQKVQSVMMMDADIQQIELIRLPFIKDAQWEQTVPLSDGTQTTLQCRIEDIAKEDGKLTYTVTYADQDGKHKEKRIIKEGTGVVYYEKLFPQGGELQGMSYDLMEANQTPQPSPNPTPTK